MKDKRRYESVAHDIARRIEEGTYASGTRLPSERELAEHYNVSRVTIRHALISLQALGKIDVRAGSGAHVLDVAIQYLEVLPSVNALELTEARLLIESQVAALAAQAIKDETLAQLEQLIQEMSRDDHEDAKASDLADQDFHLTIAAATQNSALYHIVERLWKLRMELPAVKKVYDSVCVEDATLRGSEHQEILDALQARDPSRARLAMKQHFTRLLESMLDVTERDALMDVQKKVGENRERFTKSAKI